MISYMFESGIWYCRSYDSYGGVRKALYVSSMIQGVICISTFENIQFVLQHFDTMNHNALLLH